VRAIKAPASALGEEGRRPISAAAQGRNDHCSVEGRNERPGCNWSWHAL